MQRKQPKMTTALSLVVALGAYCPRLKMGDEKQMAIDKAIRKRRTRPMTGRGGYGRNLMAAFDNRGVNWSAKPNKNKAAASR